MFTSKQQAIFEEYLKTTTLDDLYTPELPEITLPKWLHPDIKSVVRSRLEFLKTQKNSPGRLYADMYPVMVEYFERIKPIFINPEMEFIWGDLCNKSVKSATRFASEVNLYENHYDGGIGLIEKKKDEIKCCKRMIKTTQQLYDVMEEYYCHYYGHMLQEKHFEIMELLKQFKEDTLDSLTEFQKEPIDGSMLFSNHWPMTRKCIGENGLTIFFIRKIYYFFQTEFGKPMYNNIAEIIQAIFKIPFDENHIIKHCTIVKSLLSEDSTN